MSLGVDAMGNGQSVGFTVSEIRPECVAQYMAEVRRISDVLSAGSTVIDAWFRGNPDASYELVPGIYRKDNANIEEDSLRHDFRLKAFPYLSEVTYEPGNEWDWYFLMQHYGLPTRLLDWTESALVALYFCLRSAQGAGSVTVSDVRPPDAAVWVLDPYAFNQKVAGQDAEIFSTLNDQVHPYLTALRETVVAPYPDSPLALQPPLNSRRIAAQRGMFTIHGRDKRGIESYPVLSNSLFKIVIPGEALPDIREDLRVAGIKESSVFPELAGLSREILAWYQQ